MAKISVRNPDFKVVEFDHFRKNAVLPSFESYISDMQKF